MPKTIDITLNDNQLATLKNAFPELKTDLSAKSISQFAAEEMIDLLTGKKRYLSLSHQYIEWLEQINIRLLPDTEFTPSRIMNQFNFPPGSASYISRILRDRQHIVLVERAKNSLESKIKETIEAYENLDPKDRGKPGKHFSITLTKRELRQLHIILDEYEEEQQSLPAKDRDSINYPETSEIRMDFIKIKYTIEVIKKIKKLF